MDRSPQKSPKPVANRNIRTKSKYPTLSPAMTRRTTPPVVPSSITRPRGSLQAPAPGTVSWSRRGKPQPSRGGNEASSLASSIGRSDKKRGKKNRDTVAQLAQIWKGQQRPGRWRLEKPEGERRGGDSLAQKFPNSQSPVRLLFQAAQQRILRFSCHRFFWFENLLSPINPLFFFL